jgi:hypothetical protein
MSRRARSRAPCRPHGDDGRAGHVVVVARQREAVGAGRGDGEQVAGATSPGRYSASTTMSPDSQCGRRRGRGRARHPTCARRGARSTARRTAPGGRCRSCRRRRSRRAGEVVAGATGLTVPTS